MLFFIVLTGVTFIVHTCMEEFEPCGPEMLSREWQTSVHGNGTADRSGRGFRLVSKDKAARVRIHQEITAFETGSKLMLSADMGCRNIEPGEKPWHLARLVLVQNDGIKNRYDYTHVAGAISGFRAFEQYKKVFTIEPDTRSLRVIAQLNLCTGIFELKNIRMFPVVRSMAYTLSSQAVLLGWAMFCLSLVGRAVVASRNRGVLLKGMVIVLFSAIIFGTAMPWEMKNEVVRELSGQLQETSLFFDQGMSGILPKIGHFVFFSLFGMAFSLMSCPALRWRVPVTILLLAGASEQAQFFLDGRSALLNDFFIDAGGGLMGYSLIYLFHLIFYGRMQIR